MTRNPKHEILMARNTKSEILNNVKALITKIQNRFCRRAKLIEVKNEISKSLPKAKKGGEEELNNFR